MSISKPNSAHIQIAIAEDDSLHMNILERLLHVHEDMAITIKSVNGAELLTQIEQAATLPDICLLDISMPIMTGYEALPIIKKRWPSIKVLVLSSYSKDYSIIKLLKDGASGFLSKQNLNELKTAIETIFQNDYYYSKQASEDIFLKVKNGKISVPDISEKEMELLRYMCSADSYEEIASKMYISRRTVEIHRDNLFKKFSVNSRPGLIMFALQNELIALE
jgi:two-component system, NarL family, invasion response regulator UvrY